METLPKCLSQPTGDISSMRSWAAARVSGWDATADGFARAVALGAVVDCAVWLSLETDWASTERGPGFGTTAASRIGASAAGDPANEGAAESDSATIRASPKI